MLVKVGGWLADIQLKVSYIEIIGDGTCVVQSSLFPTSGITMRRRYSCKV
jgi:hypothetical protein